MTPISYFKYVLLVGCATTGVSSYAWRTLIGNNILRVDQTFSFGVKAHCAQPANQLMLVGAEDEKEAKEYALSKISLHDYQITPCAAKLAQVDSVYDQPNPLYDAGIAHIVCPTSTLAVVGTQSAPSIVYALNHVGTEPEVLTHCAKDVSGNPCASITHLETNGDKLVFAAICDASDAPALAIISYSENTEKKDVSPEEFKKLEKEIEGCKEEKQKQRLKKGVDRDQDGKIYRNIIHKIFAQDAVIALPAPVKEITALCWHPGISCLYVGVSYKLPVNNQSCGILVGRLTADKKSLVLEPVTDVCPDMFTRGKIESLVPFNTSTGSLDYLLIKNSKNPHIIHSVPLCNQRILAEREKFTLQGKLADCTEKPQEIFMAPREKFLGRQFTKPFVFVPNSPSLLSYNVGHGHMYAGPIHEIMVRGDVVFAVVSDPTGGFDAGVYQSQALYDGVGRIAGWTYWQKTVEHEGIDFALINNPKATLMVFGEDRESEKGTRTVQVNKWPEQAIDDIAQLLQVAQREFVECNQEIKKIIDWSVLTPGLCGKNLTLLMNDEKLVVAQMPDFAAITFDQEVLKAVGTLTCAQVGISDDQGWLFVGGTHGLAKLVDHGGNGWRMPEGLRDVNELSNMQTVRVGDYSMVRKLLFDQDFLYVLTDTCLDRINLQTNTTVRLADAQRLCNQRYALLYDVIVSDKCALLACSAGLYRVGNGKNIKTDTVSSLQWAAVEIPEATDLSLFLMPVSVTGNPHDWAKGAGQVYVITGSYTKKGAHVHRFAVKDVVEHEIAHDTIAPVPDLVFKDRIADIGSLLACSDCFLTDGLFYLAPFKQKKSKPMILYNGLNKARTTINLELQAEDTITSITRNSMHGNWLVAGSFGLKTNI